LTKSDFKAAVEDYVRHYQIFKRANATALECQRVLLRACADWHSRPIATIRMQEIDKLLCLIRDGNGEGTKPRPYLANKVFSLLRTFFDYCAKPAVGKVKTSPMIGIDKPFDKERPRDRFFKDDEITAIWRAADAIEGSEGRFLKLLLLTGKRKGALARMRWEHIDETWFWEPPRSELANKRLHPIPYRRWRNACLVRDNNRGSCFQGLSKGRTTSMPVPCTAACDA